MELRLENILRMYKTVNKFCMGNPVVTSLEALTNANDELAAKIQLILTAGERQAELITGITVSKNDKKNAVATRAFAVAGAVMSYASLVNDRTLFGAVNFTQGVLKKSKDQLLEQRVNIIVSAANARLAALAPFGITAAVITAVNDALADYIAESTQPRQAIASRKHYTKLLFTLFRETSTLLKNQMDKIVYGIVAQANPGFAGEYRNMRRTLNLGHSSTSVKFKIVNSSTSAPEEQVVILNQTEIETRNTNRKGKVSFTKQKPERELVFVISKTGFATKHVNVTVQSGEIVHETIELMPEPG